MVLEEPFDPTLEDYRRIAREKLGDKRYRHVLSVTRLATELAEAYGADVWKARAAALLHDVMKEVPLDVQLQMIRDSGIIIDNTFLGCTNVYHAVTARLFAQQELGIQDGDILNAIRYHTTGRAGMSLLEKIVYVADATNYERTYPEAEELRKLAFADLDECMLEILVFTFEKLTARRCVIAADTLYCYNDICQLKGEKNH